LIVTFVINLYCIIILHELGHLIVAKLCKCKVEVFSIGFWKKIIGKQIGSTYYQIALLPFGGYCKLKDETNNSKSKYAFTNLKYRYKLAISSAGCIVNILTGMIALGIGNLFLVEWLVYTGLFSILMGLTNLLPIAQCVDGGYIVWMPLYEKILGKKKGLKKFERHCKISFVILMILNVLSLIGLALIYFLK